MQLGRGATHLLRKLLSLLFRQSYQFGQNIAKARIRRGPPEVEINATVAFVQLVVGVLCRGLWIEHRVLRTNLFLRIRYGRKDSGCQKRKDGGSKSGYLTAGNQHRFSQNVGIYLVENRIVLRNAPTIDDAMRWHAILAQAIENDPSVKRGPFDSGKQFILCCVQHLPANCHASKVRIYEYGPIAVVPGHPEKPGLACTVVLQAFAQFRDRRVCPLRYGAEDLTRSGKAGF